MSPAGVNWAAVRPGVSDRRSLLPACSAVLLIVAAALIVIGGTRRPASDARRSSLFQEIVGGLGGGSALDLSRGRARLDPRLDDASFGRDPAARTLGAHLDARAGSESRQDD